MTGPIILIISRILTFNSNNKSNNSNYYKINKTLCRLIVEIKITLQKELK
ncbi:hypothetical protein GCM10010129_84750 [Streptomyces fumigatiscleroticus]|nr:hypothetical protein GCM10010129_84750 [Streptomyces fumigatiscleroticus]